MLREVASRLLTGLADATGGSSDITIGILSMVSAVIVAMVSTIGGVVVARYNRDHEEDEDRANRRRDRRSRRVATEHAAWERWFLLNGIDPRKILTGDETLAEVRHGVSPTL